MKKIEISKENVELAYKTASDNNVKNVLRALFGESVDAEKPKDVMERIKTVEDAIADKVEEVGYMKPFTPEEMDVMKDTCVGEVLDKIKEIAPDVAIIEM